MKIETKYNNGDIVFLLTDREQLERIVTAIQVSGNNGISYQLCSGTVTSWHYDFEIIGQKDFVKSLQ